MLIPISKWERRHAQGVVDLAQKHLARLSELLAAPVYSSYEAVKRARFARLCTEKAEKYVKLNNSRKETA